MAHMLTAVAWAMILVCGCQQSRDKTTSRLGTPDLIGEESGDEQRFYLPERPPDFRWPEADRTSYYLSKQLRVVVRRGKEDKVLPLDADTARKIEETRERIKAAQERSPR